MIALILLGIVLNATFWLLTDRAEGGRRPAHRRRGVERRPDRAGTSNGGVITATRGNVVAVYDAALAPVLDTGR